MSVMTILIETIQTGEVFPTPSGRSSFRVMSVSKEGLALGVGKGHGSAIHIPAQCWDGIPRLLKGSGWILVGAIHTKPKPGTLDHYVQKYTGGVSAASYVAPVLEKVRLIQIDRGRPTKVRLLHPQSPPQQRMAVQV